LTRKIFVAVVLLMTLSPCLADSTASLIDRYAQMPAMSGAVLSPSGDQLAFMSSINGRSH
jgi:hypothetical protein